MGFLANLQNSCTPPDLNIWICFTCYLFSTQFHHAVFLLALLSSSRSICSADGASNMSHIMLLVMTKEIFWLAVAHSYHIILVILGQAVPCTEIITKWFFSLLAIVIAMDSHVAGKKRFVRCATVLPCVIRFPLIKVRQLHCQSVSANVAVGCPDIKGVKYIWAKLLVSSL